MSHFNYPQNRVDWWEGVVYGVKGKPLRPHYSRGYYYVKVTPEPGKQVSKAVHRVVWEAFYMRPVYEGFVIHHIDGDTSNNRISNLEAVSAQRNSELAVRCKSKIPYEVRILRGVQRDVDQACRVMDSKSKQDETVDKAIKSMEAGIASIREHRSY